MSVLYCRSSSTTIVAPNVVTEISPSSDAFPVKVQATAESDVIVFSSSEYESCERIGRDGRPKKRRKKRKPKFKCELCPKSFVMQCHLKDHMNHHNGKKPFRCDICDKAFYRLFSLQEHQRIHNRVKPYRCNYCEKSFTQGSTLMRHKQMHISDKTIGKTLLQPICLLLEDSDEC